MFQGGLPGEWSLNTGLTVYCTHLLQQHSYPLYCLIFACVVPPRGALLTGFLPGESIGVSAYSLVHPEDIGSVVALHNMCKSLKNLNITFILN